jgi:hypothetical protein
MDQPNNSTLYFWGIYETDFPERPDVKAPGGFRISLWGLSSFCALQKAHNKIGSIPKFFIPKSKRRSEK